MCLFMGTSEPRPRIRERSPPVTSDRVWQVLKSQSKGWVHLMHVCIITPIARLPVAALTFAFQLCPWNVSEHN